MVDGTKERGDVTADSTKWSKSVTANISEQWGDRTFDGTKE